jgi:hypothetical protein
MEFPGLLVKYGRFTWQSVPGTVKYHDYPTSGTTPVFGEVHSCYLTQISNGAAILDAVVQVGALTTTRINYAIERLTSLGNNPTGNVQVYYYSIGTPA